MGWGGVGAYKHVNIPIKELERFPFSSACCWRGKQLRNRGILTETAQAWGVRGWGPRAWSLLCHGLSTPFLRPPIT